MALILVPGPNLLGYYFTFTTVGHLLAWRGAAHGLKAVTWQVSSSPIVSELRVALTLAAGEREQRVHAVADAAGTAAPGVVLRAAGLSHRMIGSDT